MFEKDGSVGTLCPIIMAKCGFGGARPPGEPPSMTPPWFLNENPYILVAFILLVLYSLGKICRKIFVGRRAKTD